MWLLIYSCLTPIVHPASAEVLADRQARLLRGAFENNATFKYAMLAIGLTVLVMLVICCISVYCIHRKRRKAEQVTPGSDAEAMKVWYAVEWSGA